MCCSTGDCKSIMDKLDIKMIETESGINIDVKPKDKTKTDSLKNLLKSCKGFCECDC